MPFVPTKPFGDAASSTSADPGMGMPVTVLAIAAAVIAGIYLLTKRAVKRS